jgi:hypothetical protein
MQKMMESDAEKGKVNMKNVGVQTNQTVNLLDDKQMNYPRKVRRKKPRAHIKETLNPTADEVMNNQEQIVYEDVKNETAPLHNSDLEYLAFNGEELLDQKQGMIAADGSDNTLDHSTTTDRRATQAVIEEQNLTTTNTINDMIADLGPIIEYAEEPLLPLAEACAPLNDILHDLSSYVQMALDETPAEPPEGLTVDESAAIRLYSIEWSGGHRSLYSMLNHTLKKEDREHLRPYFKYMKLFLTALVKLPCVPPLTIWRGVTKNVSAEFPPGTPVTWWAFSSCTTALTVLENKMYLGDQGDRTLFSVEAINGRTIRAHSHFVTEEEILLLPGTYMVVQSQFSPAPELHIIHLKQVIPEETLLQPPFEGT